MPGLIAQISTHRLELPGPDTRGGILGSPAQSEAIPRQTTRGVAAPSLEKLYESRKVDSRGCTDNHMDVGLKNLEVYDLHVLPSCCLLEIIVEERLGRRVDHRETLVGRPNEMNEDLMCGHSLRMSFRTTLA